jgi:hypothetical protein
MKYAVDVSLGAMMCIPGFIKIGSDIQKLTGRFTDTYTDRQHGNRINLF